MPEEYEYTRNAPCTEQEWQALVARNKVLEAEVKGLQGQILVLGKMGINPGAPIPQPCSPNAHRSPYSPGNPYAVGGPFWQP